MVRKWVNSFLEEIMEKAKKVTANKKTAARLAAKRAFFDRKLAGKKGYTRPGSGKHGR